MNARYVFYTLIILLFSVLSSAGAEYQNQEATSLFESGSHEFSKGLELNRSKPEEAKKHFISAAQNWERIIREYGVHNGPLLYNIGNAYLQAEELGKAIYYYNKARLFIPSDINLQQNLSYARSLRTDTVETAESEKIGRILLFWYHDISSGTRTIIFTVCFSLFWVLLSIGFLRRKPVWNKLSIIPLLLSLLFFVSVVSDHYRIQNHPDGVIQKTVIARRGDSTGYEPAFQDPLHEGTEFVLQEERKGWLYIKLPDGSKSWIPDTAALLVQ